MHIISTHLAPSVISHSTKCNLGEEYLAVARFNSIDLYELLPDKAKLLTSFELLPRIIGLVEISPDDGPGALFVITDHPDCSAIVLELSLNKTQLVVKESHKLESPYGLPLTDNCQACTVSRSRDCVAVALYQGIIHILGFSRKGDSVTVASKIECRIHEVLLLSMCFLPIEGQDLPVLSLLHQTSDRKHEVVSHAVDFYAKELVRFEGGGLPKIVEKSGHTMSRIIPITPSQGRNGGILGCTDHELIFYQTESPSGAQQSSTGKRRSIAERPANIRVKWPFASITAHAFIDENRLLLGDKYGKLVLLTLTHSGSQNRIKSLALHLLGETSSPLCITYLNAGVIFLGSGSGDSHFVSLGTEGSLRVIDSLDCIAPIGDAILADLDNTNEPVIVTCSGDGATGSLRVIRSGANMEQLSALEGIDHVRTIFPFYGPHGGRHSYVLISLFSQSLLFNSDFTEMSKSDFPAFSRDLPTLAAINIRDKEGDLTALVVQVTSSAAILCNIVTGVEVSCFEGSIVAASVNPTAVCLALSGGTVTILEINHMEETFEKRATATFESEISAISINPIRSNEWSTPTVVIGFWDDSTIRICSFKTLKELQGAGPIEMPNVPHSLMITPYSSSPGSPATTSHWYLLAGLGNGQLVSINFDAIKNRIDLTSRRSTSLGDRPVQLQRCSVGGETTVIAVGSRTVILSWGSGRLMHRHVNIKEFEGMVDYDSATYPNSTLFYGSNKTIIGRILNAESDKKLKIDTLSLGFDIPITISYHPDIKAFAVGCTRIAPSLVGGSDTITSSFKLMDALSFESLNSFSFDHDEEVKKISVENLELEGKMQTYIVVGTARWEQEESEPNKGRVLLFKANSGPARPVSRNPASPIVTLVLEHEIPGGVEAIKAINGVLIVVINTVLVVYRLTTNESGLAPTLVPLDQWTHSYSLWHLSVIGNRIIGSDAYQSVVVLEWDGSSLEFIAKDWASVYSMNVTGDEEYIIQSDVDGNLLSHSLNPPSGLERKGHYYFGENISHLMPGSITSVDSDDEAFPTPKHLLFTAGGRISIISECDDSEQAKRFLGIQRNMNSVLKQHLGEVMSWRKPHVRRKTSETPSEPFGFIDGDFLQLFLQLGPDSTEVANIMAGASQARRLEKLGLSYEKVCQLVEGLRSISGV